MLKNVPKPLQNVFLTLEPGRKQLYLGLDRAAPTCLESDKPQEACVEEIIILCLANTFSQGVPTAAIVAPSSEKNRRLFPEMQDSAVSIETDAQPEIATKSSHKASQGLQLRLQGLSFGPRTS